MDLSKIKSNAQCLDCEQLLEFLIQEVKDGKYDTCLDALVAYVEDNDISYTTITKQISPPLRAILYKEGVDKQLIRNPVKTMSLEAFF